MMQMSPCKHVSFSKQRSNEIYDILRNLRPPLPPPKLVVITDIAKDYDDLTAFLILKELHRFGLTQLIAIIANLHPALKRAHFARGAMRSLGLGDVPVAYGTSGSEKEQEVHPYEFEGCQFEVDDREELQTGNELLLKVYTQARQKNEKLVLLLISSNQDIAQFAASHPDLVSKHTMHVHIQGGCSLSPSSALQPDLQAANNAIHPAASIAFHTFLSEHNIPSSTYTRFAAFACALTPEFFAALAHTGHPLGLQLQRTHQLQEITFYEYACDPLRRFTPDKDEIWFLRIKTDWFDPTRQDYNSEKLDDLPEGKDIAPYLTKLIIYDAIAALGVAGELLDSTFGLFDPVPQGESVHKIIGIDGQRPGVRVNVVKDVLEALAEGSLLSALQGIPSYPT